MQTQAFQASLVGATKLTGSQRIDAEVTTPLYSAGRSAAILVKRRSQEIAPENVGVSKRASLIDESTLWQFVSRESIAIDGDIIRLSDVIRPLEPNLVAWSRLSEATVGLMPADGGVAKISRDRLAQKIASAKATPEKVKIYGPETIVVLRSKPPEVSPAEVSPGNGTAGYAAGYAAGESAGYSQGHARSGQHHGSAKRIQIEPVRLQVASRMPQSDIAAASYNQSRSSGTLDESEVTEPPTMLVIDPETRERLEQWVRVGVRNEYSELHNAFEYDVTFDPKTFGTLEKIQGIRQFIFLDPTPTWQHEGLEPVTCRVQLNGRAGNESCQGIVQLTFRPYPPIVTARRALRRGHRVNTGDLQYEPLSDTRISLPSDVVNSPDDLIGLEVVGLTRAGVPLSHSAFAPPRVIRRGDLLEVQVGGGGVLVTTSAKALGDGAEGELIEIETILPKRRLLAKVVHSSLVEIITQAPRVAAQPKATR